MSEYKCPHCGGTSFQLTVQQLVDVDFQYGGGEVRDLPYGDMEWDEDSLAICSDCRECAPLGGMKTNEAEYAAYVQRAQEKAKADKARDAASDLLVALQTIMAGVAGCQRDAKYEAARAAIAKATGETK